MKLEADETPEMWVDMRNVLSSGDADDHIEIMLRAPVVKGVANGPLVQIEVSAAIAYPPGALANRRQRAADLHGGTQSPRLEVGRLERRMPSRPVERTPTPGRSYNREAVGLARPKNGRTSKVRAVRI